MFGITTTDLRVYTLVAIAAFGVTLLSAVGPFAGQDESTRPR